LDLDFTFYKLVDFGWIWSEFSKFRTGSASYNMTAHSCLITRCSFKTRRATKETKRVAVYDQPRFDEMSMQNH